MTIYFVQGHGGKGPIKIGYTSGATRERLNLMQTGSPVLLTILGEIPEGTMEKEHQIHYKFDHLRLHGEWFKEDKELKDFINRPNLQSLDKVPMGFKPSENGPIFRCEGIKNNGALCRTKLLADVHFCKIHNPKKDDPERLVALSSVKIKRKLLVKIAKKALERDMTFIDVLTDLLTQYGNDITARPTNDTTDRVARLFAAQ